MTNAERLHLYDEDEKAIYVENQHHVKCEDCPVYRDNACDTSANLCCMATWAWLDSEEKVDLEQIKANIRKAQKALQEFMS